jgi:hypothetical protein
MGFLVGSGLRRVIEIDDRQGEHRAQDALVGVRIPSGGGQPFLTPGHLRARIDETLKPR